MKKNYAYIKYKDSNTINVYKSIIKEQAYRRIKYMKPHEINKLNDSELDNYTVHYGQYGLEKHEVQKLCDSFVSRVNPELKGLPSEIIFYEDTVYKNADEAFIEVEFERVRDKWGQVAVRFHAEESTTQDPKLLWYVRITYPTSQSEDTLTEEINEQDLINAVS